MLHKLFVIIDEAVPEGIRPTSYNVAVTTMNIEFCIKMVSLALSTAYLIWRWNKEYKQDKKNKL